MKRYERYVAIGDSTTEGLMDPDGAGGYRGWANRFAEHVARSQGSIQYANLAIRGFCAREVHEHQLAAAVALAPDLSTVVAGMNDLLRTRFDADEVVGHIGTMIEALTARGATVLTFTLPDISTVMPMAKLVRGRLIAFNERLRRRCAVNGALLADFAAHPVGGDRRLWHEDRLHANALGHERVAMGLADTVGLPGFEGWAEPLPAVPPRSLREAARAELRWARSYLLPWLGGRVQRESSPEPARAKRPALTPMVVDRG
jgi:lysophospholipase L1-like esterase